MQGSMVANIFNTFSMGILWSLSLGLPFFIIGCQQDQDSPSLEKGTIVFNDEFNDLNTNRWHISQQSLDAGTGASGSNLTNNFTTHFIENNDSCFIPNNLNVSANSSQLRVFAGGQALACLDTNNTFDFSGGELRSLDTFTFGRFTVNLITSLNSGALTSFYLYASNTEIGIHLPGDNPTQVYLSYHNGTTERVTPISPNSHSKISNFNSASDFHSYTILWQEGLIQWSIDGHSVLGAKTSIPSTSMNLVLSTWISGDSGQAGNPTSSPFSYTDIDFIQAESF